MNTSRADVYTDFSAFSQLRAQARSGSAEGRRAAAEQVEALFLGMMLKSMRAAGGSMLSGPGADIREGMFDSQLTLSLSKTSKLGFAELMLREFNARKTPVQDPVPTSGAVDGQIRAGRFASALWGRTVTPSEVSQGLQGAAVAAPGVPQAAAASSPAIPRSSPLPVQENTSEPAVRWNNADEFAANLWPAAQRAAQALGTRPEAVLAVAALETGWGKHLPASASGASSNNLFGIKAYGWPGPVTQSRTLEFDSGNVVRKIEPFRSYESAQQSFEDFVNVIKDRSRYAGVLDSGGDPVVFVRALQEAGYATDPKYAGKLETLMRSDTMRNAQRVAGAGSGAALSTG